MQMFEVTTTPLTAGLRGLANGMGVLVGDLNIFCEEVRRKTTRRTRTYDLTLWGSELYH